MSGLLLVLGVLGLVVLVWLLTSYNRFVRQRTLVQESWHDIDVELTRRHELVPNLVETVKGYAAHEREVLGLLVAAREGATRHRGDGPAARAAYEETLDRALHGVLARVEAYPALQASASFLSLQRELTLTEDRIAAARRFYNGNVRSYNTRVATVPSNVVAGMFGFRPSDFFESAPGVRDAGPPPVHT